MKFFEEKCLEFDMFSDDFGNPGDKTFSNKIVTIRKPRECDNCFREMKKGDRCRTQVELFDGMMGSYTWCERCCSHMANDSFPE